MSAAGSSHLTLSGLGLSPGQLERIANAAGLPVAQGEAAGDPATILVADLTKHSLREALARRPVACVEWSVSGQGALAHIMELLPSGRPTQAFALSVTTGTAARHAVARMFKDGLARALPPSITADDVAEFCITELVTNAIIHGNLAISQGGYADAQGLGDFAADVEARLEDPALASRRLTMSASWDTGTLSVAVADEGDGFVLDDHPAEIAPELGTGRGLGLIRSLGVTLRSENQGRRICLVFP